MIVQFSQKNLVTTFIIVLISRILLSIIFHIKYFCNFYFMSFVMLYMTRMANAESCLQITTQLTEQTTI